MTPQPRPTRRAKRWLIATAFVALTGIAGAAVALNAHGAMRWRHGQAALSADPATRAQQIDRLLRHVYIELDVTDAQKASLDPIFHQALEDLDPLRQRMRAGRAQGLEILGQTTVDRNALEALRVSQLATAEEASRVITQVIADVADVLTPAQRQQLIERIQTRHPLAFG